MDQSVERNPYADHLVEVNKTNPVVTTEDVCNTLGATIVPKDTYITEDVANKIARFDLALPLELQVNLAKSLNSDQLLNSIRSAQDDGVRLHSFPFGELELARQCSQVENFPLVGQKLTVFAERIPDRFELTQSAAGFALMIGLQLQLDETEMDAVFMATQMHDTGRLNIAPEKFNDQGQMGEEEQRDFSSQQFNLAKQFLDRVPGLSQRVGRFILEQRERIDGSGWPKGLSGNRLGIASQVVAFAILLSETLSLSLKPRGYGIQHLSPWVQMESEAFDLPVYCAVSEVLKRQTRPPAGILPREDIPYLAHYLSVLQRTLVHWLSLANRCAEEIMEVRDSDVIRRPQLIIKNIQRLYLNAGLAQKELRDWLSGVDQDSSSEELDEVELVAMMYEVMLQKLKRVQWALREAARQISSEWTERCDELGQILYRLPEDHFEALQRYNL